jgi:hypothetical protein
MLINLTILALFIISLINIVSTMITLLILDVGVTAIFIIAPSRYHQADLINLVLTIMPSINHNSPNKYSNYHNNLIIRVIAAIYLITLVIAITILINVLSIIRLGNNYNNHNKSRNHHKMSLIALVNTVINLIMYLINLF